MAPIANMCGSAYFVQRTLVEARAGAPPVGIYQLVSTLINAYLSLLGRVPVVGLILAASVSVIVGDYAAKAWSMSHREWYLFLAFAGYFFSGFFYIPTLLRDGLIVTSVIWVLLSTIGFLVIGILIFKETLSLTQTIAVILGVISVLVLTISGH